MKIYPECIPCTYKVCLSALNAANLNDTQKIDYLNKMAKYISEQSTDDSPGMYHSKALHLLSKITGIEDLFKEAKRNSNLLAMSCLDHVTSLIKAADDPLYMAFKVSVAGNIIDLGIMPDFDLDKAIDEIPSSRFYIDSYHEFRELTLSSGSVLIVGDNSGEIAFDMLLVKELQNLGIDVVYAVKGGPILNDATMEDAQQVGMTKVCRVITNGNSFLGTDIDSCSNEFLEELRKAGAVILKGQANFESLEGSEFIGDKAFFVLKVKCECVGRCAGAPFGSLVFMRNNSNCKKQEH